MLPQPTTRSLKRPRLECAEIEPIVTTCVRQTVRITRVVQECGKSHRQFGFFNRSDDQPAFVNG